MGNTRRAAACLAALLLAAAPLLAQAASPVSQPTAAAFSPFPTLLRAAMRDGKVELTWRDSADVQGGYAVFRHSAVPSQANLAAATKLGVVERGRQSFIDTPPDESPYYYFVFALADDGSPYEAFVPGSNATAAPVSLKPAAPAIASAAAAETAKPAPTAAPAAKVAAPPAPSFLIESLAAQPRSDSIQLRYTAARGLRLVAYRGTTPLLRASDLLDASLVATFADKDGSFVDYPVPGIDYWYALLAEEDLKAGRIDLVAGKNATATAVRIAVTEQTGALASFPPNSRTPPLPSFLLDEATGTALPSSPVEAPPKRELAPETEKALVASILPLAPPIKRPLPPLYILPTELEAPSGGEDYALSLIVTDKLVKRDWTAAVDQLRKYLSLNRSVGASARARFYLGQALAYSGSYRDAFFEFLSARALYPTESGPWIEYVLAALRQG